MSGLARWCDSYVGSRSAGLGHVRDWWPANAWVRSWRRIAWWAGWFVARRRIAGRSGAVTLIPGPIRLIISLTAGILDTLIDLGITAELRFLSDTSLPEALAPAVWSWRSRWRSAGADSERRSRTASCVSNVVQWRDRRCRRGHRDPG